MSKEELEMVETTDHAADKHTDLADAIAGDDKSKHSPERKKGSKRWVWISVVVVFLAIAVFAWEFTSTPLFCGSCHEIKPSVDGWEGSAHSEQTCLDCHSDKGFIGEAVAHIGGIQEVVMKVAESPDEQDIRGFVPAYRCMECHEKDWDKLPDTHPEKDSQCGVCHRDTAHTNPKPLYVKEEVKK